MKDVPKASNSPGALPAAAVCCCDVSLLLRHHPPSTMSDVNAAAAAPLGHLNLDTLQILLQHAPDLLSIRELGRLSACSNILIRITEDAAVW
jgi:hypothetical protein